MANTYFNQCCTSRLQESAMQFDPASKIYTLLTISIRNGEQLDFRIAR